jgi:hypothetical protein
MNDVVFLALLIVLFALAVLFIAGCDRIIGHAEDAGEPVPTASPAERRAA